MSIRTDSGYNNPLSRRLAGAAALLAALSVSAVEIPPPGDPFFIQTNSSDAAIGLGDWYTADTNGVGGGFHYVGIYVPCGWPTDQEIHIDLFSPEMNSANPDLDEVNSGGPGTTTFELFDVGAVVVSPATPAPGAPGSLLSIDYPPSAPPEQWVRAFTLGDDAGTTAPISCGQYVLRIASTNDDQNAWRLRVGFDNDTNPNNPFPANWDDFDGIPGTDDELLVGLYQYSFQQDSGGVQCNTLYEFVPENSACPNSPPTPPDSNICFNNFDMDGNTRVRYYPPLTPLDPNGLIGGLPGTLSPNGQWNGGSQTERGGDLITNPQVGWWGIVSCLSSNNQLAQDAQENVPQFNQIPPIPVIELTKDDGRVVAGEGDTLTYTIRFENISDDDLLPGAARNLTLTDTLPSEVSYVSCAIDAPFSGTCSETGGVVTFDITETVLAGEVGTVTLTTTINGGATFPFTNTIVATYTDSWEVGSYTARDDETTFSATPLSLDKTVDTPLAAVGDTVNYTYTITNISPDPVVLVDLVDDKIGTFEFSEQFPQAVALYDFSEGPDPAVVRDTSGFLSALDLTVEGSSIIYELDPARIDIDTPNRLSNSLDSSKIITECQAEGQFALEAWVQPVGVVQGGPARIIHSSLDAANINFSLYQDNDQYGFFIRTPTNTDPTADVVLTTAASSVSTDLTHLLVVVEAGGDATLYQDGAVAASANVGATGNFSSWNGTWDFGIGNQFSAAAGSSAEDWQGQLYKSAVYCDEIRPQDAANLFNLGSESDPSGNRLLEPGEQVIVTAPYVITTADFPGPVVNLAEVNGLTAGNQAFTVSDTESVDIDSQQLALTKVSDAGSEVAPGQIITYTLTLTNTDTITHTGITIVDPLPPGTSYVSQSTVVQGRRELIIDYRDDFNDTPVTYSGSSGATPWTSSWIELDDGGNDGPAAGDVFISGGELQFDRPNSANTGAFDTLQRAVDLTGASSASLTFSFDFDGATEACAGGFGADDCLFAEASDDGSSWTTLITLSGDPDNNNGTRTVAIPAGLIGADTQIRFRALGFRGGDENVTVDNVIVDASSSGPVTLDNVPGGGNDLDDGVPADLVTTADSLILNPGESMTVTFQVQVDDPLNSNIIAIRNLASADTDQGEPTVAEVLDPVRPFGGQIGDSVWLDIDGDGIFDLGEAGLANVTVQLIDTSDGSVIAITRTDLTGRYLFPNLAAGSYEVAVVESTLPAGLVAGPGNSNPAGVFTVAGVERFDNADFGYVPTINTALIGDSVFADADGDGVQDPGEAGYAGVTVELRDALTGAVVATTTTGPDGRYLFSGLPPDTYVVTVTDTVGVLGAAGSTTGGNESPPITVTPGDIVTDADFGYLDPFAFAIEDEIWFDADGNGLRTSNESGIAGVSVNLVDAGGNVVATTISGSDGSVSFSGLPNGSYQLELADTQGVLSGFGGTTAAAVSRATSATINNANVSATSFGFNLPGLIGNEVFSDANGNGVLDPGEVLIPGVDLSLFVDDGDGVFDSAIDTLVNTAQTDSGGIYGYRGLAFSRYFVSLDLSQSVLAGATLTTGDSQTGGNATGAQIDVLLSGGNGGVLTADFGFLNAALPDISGNVFEDLDRDGVDDGAAETGFSGVTVELFAAGPDGVLGSADDLVVATAVTDGAGDYQFTDVPPGDYRLEVTDRAQVLTDFGLTSGLDRVQITVAGDDIEDLDFGYARAFGDASLGDLVWLDANGNGINEAGEAGLAGVTLNLFDAGPDGVIGGGDDVLIASTVTDQLGGFDFKNLPAGRYFVDVDQSTVPPGLTLSPGLTDPSAVVALGAGDNIDTLDFGYRPDVGTALVGDQIWIDANGNGEFDLGEAGLPGVTVSLIGAGPDGQLGTGDDLAQSTVSGPDGSYSFAGLPPDNYAVTVDTATLPPGFNPTPSNAQETYQLTAEADTAYLLLDWGFVPTVGLASLGDTAFIDNNGNGVQDGDESGLGGLSIDLLGPGPDGVFGSADDEVLASTITDGQGNYDFTGLNPGDYQVRLTDTAGVLTGLNPTTANPGTITLSAGQDFDDADFGFFPASSLGSVGDLVFHDVNGDGVRQPSESGIESVLVELWLDVNDDGVITPGIDNLIRSVRTDVNGEYEFGGVAPEDYLVRLAPQNFQSGGVLEDTTNTAGTPGVNNNAQADPLPLTIDSGNLNPVFADFGVNAPASFSLAGTVFEDISNDGVDQPGEPDVGGVAVLLFRDLDGDGVLDPSDPVFGSTVTDAGGDYLFDNLPPGDYLVATDVLGTRLDGFFQTTQTLTSGVQPVTGSATDVITGLDFGFFNGGITTTPVTLSYFEAVETKEGVQLRWATATESGNVGFAVHARGADGALKRQAPVIPSKVVDSTRWQSYELQLTGHAVDKLWLSDIDTRGVETLHGPFELGQVYGADRPPSPIDWRAIRAQNDATLQKRSARKGAAASRVMDVSVAASGITRITASELAAAGMDLTGVTGVELALSINGQPVPARVSDSGPFSGDAFVEFLAEARDSLYGSENVYRLAVDQATAARVAVNRAVPSALDPDAVERATLTLAENNQYSFGSPTDDPWFIRELLAFTSPVEADFALELTGYEGGSANLTVDFWGVTDLPQNPDHHVQVLVNGVLVGEQFLDGLTAGQISASISAANLVVGTNTVTVRLPADTGAQFDLVNLESISLAFDRAPMITGGAGEITVPAGGDVPAPNPDTLFASSFETIPGAAFSIAGLSADEAVAYALVNGQPVYLENAAAVPDGAGFALQIPALPGAQSIRVSQLDTLVPSTLSPAVEATDLLAGTADYLMIAHPVFLDGIETLADFHRGRGLTVKVVSVDEVYSQYSRGQLDAAAVDAYIADAVPALGLQYVLLVGGDSYDYHNYLGLGSLSFVPSLYGQVHPVVRYAPLDALYADVDGDEVPDVALGRFPVRTEQELSWMIDKTIQYTGKAYDRQAIFAADEAEPLTPFGAISDDVIDSLLTDWTVSQTYLDNVTPAQATIDIQAAINSGVALTNYFGHSGFTEWGRTNRLLTSDDVDLLTNAGLPTVVNQWGCWNAYYVSPFADTLAHRFLVGGNYGAAAILGPVSLTRLSSEQLLSNLSFAELVTPGFSVGNAITAGKQVLSQSHPDREDVVLGYTLLGDPALRIID
ncbi:MAG: SdrD B-like domain-containing protein [Pseudomonadota bacterium]